MDQSYRNAQRAHDDIFLAEVTNDDVIQRYNDFEEDFENDKSRFIDDITFLTSLSRILLLRMGITKIIQETQRSTEKVIYYKFGRNLYKCDHFITKGYSVIYQPANLHLHGIGGYYCPEPSVVTDLSRIASLSSFDRIARRMRRSRTTGTPITPFGDLNQADADFLNRFVFLQDLEVVRRLYRYYDDYGRLIREPTNLYDHLPVGVAIAAASYLMLRRDNKYSFHKKNVFGAFAEKKPWDRNKVPKYKDWVKQAAENRSQVIRKLMNKLRPFRFTVNGIKKLIFKEFGTQN